MRITKRTNIAIRLLMYCAVNTGRLVTKAEIARCCNVSENHLAQVTNQLSQLKYLHTQRGRNGGMELGMPADQISIGKVFRQVEGTVPESECFGDRDGSCPLVSACRLRVTLAEASNAFYAHLDDVTLDVLVRKNKDLEVILSPVSCAA